MRCLGKKIWQPWERVRRGCDEVGLAVDAAIGFTSPVFDGHVLLARGFCIALKGRSVRCICHSVQASRAQSRSLFGQGAWLSSLAVMALACRALVLGEEMCSYILSLRFKSVCHAFVNLHVMVASLRRKSSGPCTEKHIPSLA